MSEEIYEGSRELTSSQLREQVQERARQARENCPGLFKPNGKEDTLEVYRNIIYNNEDRSHFHKEFPTSRVDPRIEYINKKNRRGLR
ncbi:hypothetical protein ACFL0X_02315 [Nanoarchaeota archaeon]